MANDRLYMECKNCKKIMMILKYYPSGNSYVFDAKHLEDFLVWHLNCSKPTQDLNGDRCFNIFTESSDYYDSRDWEKNW